jgi:hypothetical protein
MDKLAAREKSGEAQRVIDSGLLCEGRVSDRAGFPARSCAAEGPHATCDGRNRGPVPGDRGAAAHSSTARACRTSGISQHANTQHATGL